MIEAGRLHKGQSIQLREYKLRQPSMESLFIPVTLELDDGCSIVYIAFALITLYQINSSARCEPKLSGRGTYFDSGFALRISATSHMHQKVLPKSSLVRSKAVRKSFGASWSNLIRTFS